MSNPVTTEAVVLKSMKYRETSRIVTFYTRGFGKLKAIAKGARQPKNKFGASLEPMSYVVLVVYRKDHRDIQLISQCDRVGSFRRLYEDFDKIAVGMAVVELVDKVSHGEEKNERLFRLLTGALSAIDRATKKPWYVLYGFEIDLAGVLGFQPNFEKCVRCKREPGANDGGHVVFHVSRGAPLCSSCGDEPGMKVKISAQSFYTIQQLARARSADARADVVIDETVRDEVQSFLLGFLRFHVEGLQRLKAEKVLSRIFA